MLLTWPRLCSSCLAWSPYKCLSSSTASPGVPSSPSRTARWLSVLIPSNLSLRWWSHWLLISTGRGKNNVHMQRLAQPQFHLYAWIRGQRRQAACWKWSGNTSITTQDEPWFLTPCLAAPSASLLQETVLGPWPPTDLGVGFTSKKCNKHFAVLMLTAVCLFLGTQHSHPPVHCLYHKGPKHTQKQIWLAQDSARCGSVGPQHQPGTASACNCCSPQISGRLLPGTTRSRVYQENLSSCIPLWSRAVQKKKTSWKE